MIEFQNILDCRVSGQINDAAWQEHLSDKPFSEWLFRKPADPIKVGDLVQKVKGYKWPGEVVAVFQTIAGETRIVVECTSPDVAGALHIYNAGQLEKV